VDRAPVATEVQMEMGVEPMMDLAVVEVSMKMEPLVMVQLMVMHF